jgi:signal transduction histidine kinase
VRRMIAPLVAPRSLTLRVAALSTVWTIIAMIAIATLILTLYRQSSQRDFDRLLSAHLFSLIGAVNVSDGTLQGAPELGDIRFVEPLSGWYWTVTPVTSNLEGRLASPSTAGHVIPAPSQQQVPFDAQFRRRYQTRGPGGEKLSVLETEVVLDADNRIARFSVMGNLDEFDGEVRAFRDRLYAYLGLFALGSIAINAAAIIFGLRPLARARRALADIREGRAARLGGPFPDEIAPLAVEMNALIENNQRIVERARTQVGNLAHSLKTPLSVLLNEARAIGGGEGRVIAEQAEAMQVQVQHYLQRARIAAQRDSVVFRTPVAPAIERMVRVAAKLNPGKSIRFDNRGANEVFAGEREDLEEIVGNLLENAGKWGLGTVIVTLRSGKADPARTFEIEVADDGPGLEPDQIGEAVMRGRRLDQSKPGSGLGLSIVKDTVGAYDGTVEFGRSTLGGLSATVVLPLVD